MSDVKAEEYRFLRQELEANRKLIFERPLLIVAATLAAASGAAQKEPLGLAALSLAVLVFNLWFTYNRLESSARIVAYIQLVHEGEATLPWVGWETALRRYRQWYASFRSEVSTEIQQFDSMAFYAPIFYFHLCLGILVSTTLLARSEALGRLMAGLREPADVSTIVGSMGALLVFGIVVLKFRPSTVRHLLELRRLSWEASFGKAAAAR